ncbi:MAG: carbamate kinase [Nitrospirae bacterium]|nr:carbamate kinase [Nitrospirota bacterium]
MSLIVAALGGNALIKKGQRGTIKEQFTNTFESMEYIADLIKAGHQVVLTHGNGPQVGFIMIQVEAAIDKAPYIPLNIDVAQSQGSMGYMIAQSLKNQLKDHHLDTKVTAVMTQVQVDQEDTAFDNPTKPVGPFYDIDRIKDFEKCGHIMVEDSGRGWRRVVPSPKPVEIIEADIIKYLIADGVIVVACGGGGIPVVEKEGDLTGVDAVIDKDLVSSLLAVKIKADILLFVTSVDKVALNYNTPEQVNFDRMHPDEAHRYLVEGHFPEGSMGPKIEASLEFIRNGGKKAIICRPEAVIDAMQGTAGTVIEK